MHRSRSNSQAQVFSGLKIYLSNADDPSFNGHVKSVVFPPKDIYFTHIFQFSYKSFQSSGTEKVARSNYKAVRSSAHQDNYYPLRAMDDSTGSSSLAFRTQAVAKCPWIEFEFEEAIDISALEIIFNPWHSPDETYFKPGVQLRIGNTTTSMQDLGTPEDVDNTHSLIATYRQV